MGVILGKEIEYLKKEILSLSAMVEEAVGLSVRALTEHRVDYAKRVVDSDPEVDNKEIDVEEECLKLLALHQPVASDLRFIVAVLKINSDLERVGDLAVNISERAIMLDQTGHVTAPFDVMGMSERARLMLKSALDSLVNLDAGLARKVCVLDDDVDRMNQETYQRVTARIKANPEETEKMIMFLQVSRSLERIGDHATNIAEDVIYMTEGGIVRHRPERFGPR